MKKIISLFCLLNIVTTIAFAQFETLGRLYNNTNSELPSNSLKMVEIDHENNKWVTTENHGVAILHADNESWTYYDRSNTPFPSNNVIDLAIDHSNGEVWLAFTSELLVWNSTEKTWRSYSGPLKYAKTMTIALDSQGNKWIGTFNGLFQLTADEQWIRHTTKNSALLANVVSSIHVDQNDTKWITTASGYYALSKDGKWSTYFENNTLLPNALHYGTTTDEQGNVFFKTHKGLYVLKNDGTWQVLNQSTTCLPTDDIHHLAFDTKGGLWIGSSSFSSSSMGEGFIYLRSLEEGDCQVFNASNSLLNTNDIKSMNFDEQGNLWVATNGDSPSEGGLLLFTPPDIDFITPVNEVNEMQEFQLHSFPNPSTTATTISYHIPNNNQVQLQLYDLNGRLIETIFNQKQGQGNYQVRVPTDHLSKGIYFCKLQSDKHQIHHKIIVN